MSQPDHGPDSPQAALRWPAERHEAYLASRPDSGSSYNPAAEYGDVDWREPASDAEAAARTAWLAENTPPAPDWPTRPLTPVENALEDAQERAVLSDRAQDYDPYAWAEYERLHALDRLAPLPVHDALDALPRDERGQPDTLVAPARHDDDPVARDHQADEAAIPGDYVGDPERLRPRVDGLRASLAAGAWESITDGEERREQLARWHDDDATTRDADVGDNGDGNVGELGWGR